MEQGLIEQKFATVLKRKRARWRLNTVVLAIDAGIWRGALQQNNEVLNQPQISTRGITIYSFPLKMASRSIAANCRKAICIGRNYAYALPHPPISAITTPRRLRAQG